MTKSEYLSIRATIMNEELVSEYEKVKYENNMSDKELISEALAVYLLDESEDNRLTVKKK